MKKSVDDSNSNILKRVLIHFLMINGKKNKNIVDNFVFFLVNGVSTCFKKCEMEFY
jgi:hypothetical protein